MNSLTPALDALNSVRHKLPKSDVDAVYKQVSALAERLVHAEARKVQFIGQCVQMELTLPEYAQPDNANEYQFIVSCQQHIRVVDMSDTSVTLKITGDWEASEIERMLEGGQAHWKKCLEEDHRVAAESEDNKPPVPLDYI